MLKPMKKKEKEARDVKNKILYLMLNLNGIL